MSRPTIDRALLLNAIAPYGITLAEHPVIAVGVQGGLTHVPNRIGGFDDLLAVVTPELCEGFTGNTDPSSEVPGRANLVVGVHWFKPGLHHRGTPKEYPAFIQAAPVTVKRWQTEAVPKGTKDTRGECLGDGLWRGEFYIHIHNAMGVNTTGSEGCQTIIKTEWDSYHTLLLHELTSRSIVKFPYVLIARSWP
jgi:hypothetical protein